MTQGSLYPPILITGATGHVGQLLCRAMIADGLEPIGVTRDVEKAKQNDPLEMSCVAWEDDIATQTVRPIAGIVNLAGESLAAKRWSESQKQVIYDSRIKTTEKLFQKFEASDTPPAFLINASAVGFYGPAGDEKLDEDTESGSGFASRLCQDWERAAKKFESLGTSVAVCRIGVVLGEKGALKEIAQSFKMGVATTMGNGRHYFSWIHEADLILAMMRLVKQYLHDESPKHSVYNCTAPQPVTYGELTQALKKQYKTLLSVPLPGWMMRMIVGEMADELLLTGQRVVPKHLLDDGFEFEFPTIDDALTEVRGRR